MSEKKILEKAKHRQSCLQSRFIPVFSVNLNFSSYCEITCFGHKCLDDQMTARDISLDLKICLKSRNRHRHRQ